MKQLTQAVFELPECPKWAKSAAVDSDGTCYLYSVSKKYLDIFECENDEGEYYWCSTLEPSEFIEVVGLYDTTNWQQSAINREPE